MTRIFIFVLWLKVHTNGEIYKIGKALYLQTQFNLYHIVLFCMR